MAKLMVGQKWGRLECTADEVIKFEVKRGAVTDKWEESAYKIRCECGRVVVMRPKEFPGKRAMKDCGCGIGKDDGAYVLVAFSAPAYIRQRLTAYQSGTQLSFSGAAVEVIKAGLKTLEVQGNGKKRV